VSPNSTVIDVQDVSKRFGDRRVLESISLQIEAGQLIAVVGRSGSGKTTLVSLLAGFAPPDTGTIVGGSREWNEMTVVPQTLGLLDELTAVENVGAPLRLRGVTRRDADAAGTAVLDELGLAELAGRFVGEMSAGQRQRVALARALIGTPRVLLADEPTSHLDDVSRGRVIAAITRRVTNGMAAVLVTHDHAVRDAADRVVEIGRED
jgi:putative ABC transport system ATP-binding protein